MCARMLIKAYLCADQCKHVESVFCCCMHAYSWLGVCPCIERRNKRLFPVWRFCLARADASEQGCYTSIVIVCVCVQWAVCLVAPHEIPVQRRCPLMDHTTTAVDHLFQTLNPALPPLAEGDHGIGELDTN